MRVFGVLCEVLGSSCGVLGDSLKAKYTIFAKDLNDLRKQRVFQKLQRFAQGRFHTYPEDILEAPGRVIWVPGGGSGGRAHETWRVWEGPGPSQKQSKCVFRVPWKPNVDIYNVF